MYTFLVVDDESLVRENIVFLLRQSSGAPFLIMEAEDGDTAMDILGSRAVDVLLLDVRMLRVGGLQLMEWLHDKSWEGQYAVISGYSNFSYVQKAIAMGAANYILKPIDEDQFFPAIDSMLTAVERHREERLIKIRYSSKLLENYWLRVERCFTKQLEGSPSPALAREQEELDRDGGRIGMMCVLLCNVDPPGITREELLAVLCAKAKQMAEKPDQVGVIRNYRFDHEMVLLLRSPAEGTFFDLFWEQAQLTAGKGQISAAVQTVEAGMASLSKAYRQCRGMLKQRFLNGRGWMRDAPKTPETAGMFDKGELLGRFRQLLRNRGIQSFQAMEELLGRIFSRRTFAALKLEALQSLFRQTAAVIWEETRTEPKSQIHVELDHFDTIDEVVTYLMELTRLLLLPENMGGSFREFYQPICGYIEEHFREPITLMELAGQFQFHPNYFSGAFRDLAGVSFQDYVMALRLKEAKALLSGSGLSVRQIAMQVGYNSQSYFQRVFKKAEGITPMEYRLLEQAGPPEWPDA